MRPLIRLGSAVALFALATVAVAGCTKKSDSPGATSTAKAAGTVKVALVPGGAHPYF